MLSGWVWESFGVISQGWGTIDCIYEGAPFQVWSPAFRRNNAVQPRMQTDRIASRSGLFTCFADSPNCTGILAAQLWRIYPAPAGFSSTRITYALQLGNHVLGGAFYLTGLYRDLRETSGLCCSVTPKFH